MAEQEYAVCLFQILHEQPLPVGAQGNQQGVEGVIHVSRKHEIRRVDAAGWFKRQHPGIISGCVYRVYFATGFG